MKYIIKPKIKDNCIKLTKELNKMRISHSYCNNLKKDIKN